MMIGKIGTQNTGINISAINQSLAHKDKALSGKSQDEQRIQAIISPVGKKESMIQQLMKQKQELTDRMNSLSVEGESGSSIKEQMKELQAQMDTLDEQITQLQTQKEEDNKKNAEESTGIYEKPKTKAEAESDQLKNMMNMAFTADQAEVIDSVKNGIDGRANVLKAEVKTGNGNIEKKIEEIADLEARSADLSGQIGEKLQNTLQQTVVEEAPQESEEVQEEQLSAAPTETLEEDQ